MPIKALVFACLILVLYLPASFAGEKSSLPSSVETYKTALKNFESGEGSFEEVFLSGLKAARDIEPFLEGFSGAEMAAAQKEMRGFDLICCDVYNAALPGSSFFVELSKKSKVEADQDFIDLYFKTNPDGVMAAYVEQQTDYSGCTLFNGSLTMFYKNWSSFQKKYPKAYPEQVKTELSRILEEITDGTCVCGDSAGFQKELGGFPTKGLSAENKDKIKDRRNPGLNGIIRFNCGSG